jgi:transcription initiation factor TFIIIB Brf1 subunit/transcription initiation factor TFIIB
MPLTPRTACPKCGAEAVNITSFSDSREQFFCADCGAFEGDALDLAEKAIELAKFQALAARMRAADRGE